MICNERFKDLYDGDQDNVYLLLKMMKKYGIKAPEITEKYFSVSIDW